MLDRLAALADGAQTAPLGESYWAVRRLLEALGATPAGAARARRRPLGRAGARRPDRLSRRPRRRAAARRLPRPAGARHGRSASRSRSARSARRRLVRSSPARPWSTRRHARGSSSCAEGNALYAEQLASFAAEGGEGLPPTLEAVLAGRLGRLDPAERSVLQRAAVVGREFSLGAVAALADGEVASDLLSLSRARLRPPRRGRRPGRRRLHASTTSSSAMPPTEA